MRDGIRFELLLNHAIQARRVVVHNILCVVQALIHDVLEVPALALVSGIADLLSQIVKRQPFLVRCQDFQLGRDVQKKAECK